KDMGELPPKPPGLRRCESPENQKITPAYRTDGGAVNEMITPENINFETLTDEDAAEILKGMVDSREFLFKALDQDGDGRLSPAEIDAAPKILRSLDKDGDGALNESELEGYGFHFIPGQVRSNAIVRMLDLDGDLRVTAEDIAEAPNRIRRLDRDMDGIVRREDVFSKLPKTILDRIGGAADMLWFLYNLSYYTDDLIGEVLPGSDSRGMSDGYTLLYEANSNADVQVAKKVFLLGSDGKPVHAWDNPNPEGVPEATSADLLPNGLLLRTVTTEDIANVHHWFPVASHGTVQLVDWDGTVVWQYTRCARGKHCLHHDSKMLPNGNILVFSWEALTKAEAKTLGWEDQEILNPRGDGYIWGDRLLELKPNLEDGSTDIAWEWAALDHIVQHHDPDTPNYGKPSEQRHKLHLNYTKYANYLFTYGQLFHCNSVSYNEERDQLIISSAQFSELWVIDHSGTTEETRGSKGDLLFRWGNAETYSDEVPTFNRQDKLLYWQHDVQWLTDDLPHTGEILVTNNGAMRGLDTYPNPDEKSMGFGSAYTEVLEVTFPTTSEGAYDWEGEVTIDWSFKGDPPEAMFSPFMSGADRTPSGNTVFIFGHNKRIIEVTPEGEVVADFVPPGPGRAFRVRRYGYDYPGLARLK
ncbi:MAG: aryl-sulfate sulfotransferase, partial [Chloroflexota bacterium]